MKKTSTMNKLDIRGFIISTVPVLFMIVNSLLLVSNMMSEFW